MLNEVFLRGLVERFQRLVGRGGSFADSQLWSYVTSFLGRELDEAERLRCLQVAQELGAERTPKKSGTFSVPKPEEPEEDKQIDLFWRK